MTLRPTFRRDRTIVSNVLVEMNGAIELMDSLYLFTPENNSAVLCVAVATGDSWLLEADAEGYFHDLATDGVYLYSTAPWDHVQTCWKIIYDEMGKPMGLKLIEQDITPE